MIEEIGRLLLQEVRLYLADDRHWQQPPPPARPAAPRWPASTPLWWRLHSTAVEYAWNYGRISRGISLDESDPRRRLLDSVARAAAEHALQACRRYFGTGYLSGRRAELNRAKERAVGQALSEGAPSLRAAFDAAGVSRSAGNRILRRRHKK